MCELKRYARTSNTRIDSCIRNLVNYLNYVDIDTVASCCGHGKYPVTVAPLNNETLEVVKKLEDLEE